MYTIHFRGIEVQVFDHDYSSEAGVTALFSHDLNIFVLVINANMSLIDYAKSINDALDELL